MAYKTIAFVCLQFAVFNTISAHCVNRLVPGVQQNLLPMPLPVTETLLQNQMIISPNCGAPIMEIPYGMERIVANPIPAATIIQDSTVANNLANALQLLVVSNLLSNTLPLSTPEVVVPAVGFGSPLDYGLISTVSPVVSPIGPIVSPISSCGPYNYIY